MRRWLACGALLIAALLVPAAGAQGSDRDKGKEGDEGDKQFTIEGEIRTRWEYLENFTDADDELDDSGSFFPYRARIGARGMFSDDVWGLIEIQNFGSWGRDFTPSEAFSNDPVGQDFAGNDDSEVHLYQAYVELNELLGTRWSVTIGRAEHTLGNELMIGDADFYAGQSFDGVRGIWDLEATDLDLFYYVVNEFDDVDIVFGGPQDSDVTFSGVSVDFGIGDVGTLEPYLLFLRDGDYDGTFSSGGKLYTLGARFGRAIPTADDDRVWDWNAEVAVQSGDLEPNGLDQSFGGNIAEAWLGYNFGGDDSHHRLHAGVLYASGDDDLADDDFDAFVPLFPDDHAHNRLGDLDLFGGFTNIVGSGLAPGFSILTGAMSNVTDINLGWEWWGGKNSFMLAGHNLTTSEDFGTEDAIGNELDARYGYEYSDHVAFEAGVANLFAGDLLGADADDILRGWWQVRLRW